MLRVVIVEQETIAKDLIFALRNILSDEFSFTYYDRIVDLIKDDIETYDVIILNETYNNIRITSALNFSRNNIVLIYLCYEKFENGNDAYGRVFRIYRDEMETELQIIKDPINQRLMKHGEYFLTYNGLSIRLKYYDIYYILKDDKNLAYHTKRGVFYERESISNLEKKFKKFDFIRINSGIIVNFEYILKIDFDSVEMQDHEILPISRARRSKLLSFMKEKAESIK